HCAREATLVTTILGSCISVCLWDRRRRIGGMNHYVLPNASDPRAGARYGDVAIEALIEGMIDLGCRTEALCAKVYGGAAVLPFDTTGETVGARNLQLGLERLRRHRIPVIARVTGGARGMLITFNTLTGDVSGRTVAGVAEAGMPLPVDGCPRAAN